MLRYAVAAILLTSTISPALADWYVVKDKAGNKCQITETKPDGEKIVMVGTETYATKNEAKEARKAMSDDCRWQKEEEQEKKDKKKP